MKGHEKNKKDKLQETQWHSFPQKSVEIWNKLDPAVAHVKYVNELQSRLNSRYEDRTE